ncbi:MAG: hypothetical protein WCZ89_10485, partial [Phycisphaerae bacterium]
QTLSINSVILSGTKNLCVLEYADYQDLAGFYALEILRSDKSGWVFANGVPRGSNFEELFLF